MPKLLSIKFAENEMPRLFDPGDVESTVAVSDFVVAPRDDNEDVGFVAGIEYVSRDQLKIRHEKYRRVVRLATAEEKEAYFVRKAMERKAMALCKELVRTNKVQMKISRVRIVPADGRVIFQFTADTRVDFRQLVRELSAQLKVRVEFWQIGVRDEAKLIDGFGICGLRTCCSSWLKEFHPINLRMAKDQDISLPPSKLSGLCGRLLCCLSYEVDQYKELGKLLKPKGATITVDGKDGVIIDRNVIAQRYVVKLSDGSIQTVSAEALTNVRVPEQMKQMGERLRPKFDEGSSSPAAPAEATELKAPVAPREDEDSDSGQEERKRRRGKRGGSRRARGAGKEGEAQEGKKAPERKKDRAGGSGKPGRGDSSAKDSGEKPGAGEARRKGRRRGRRGGKNRPGGGGEKSGD